ITQKQGSMALHAQNIQLAVNAGLDDEANGARELMTMFVATPADVWLSFLAAKEKERADVMDGVKDDHPRRHARADGAYSARVFGLVPRLLAHGDNSYAFATRLVQFPSRDSRIATQTPSCPFTTRSSTSCAPNVQTSRTRCKPRPSPSSQISLCRVCVVSTLTVKTRYGSLDLV
ncbi:hypothetical protein EXIGLDRAFT_737544, partial [Exidia glandulosa HHB12029]